MQGRYNTKHELFVLAAFKQYGFNVIHNNVNDSLPDGSPEKKEQIKNNFELGDMASSSRCGIIHIDDKEGAWISKVSGLYSLVRYYTLSVPGRNSYDIDNIYIVTASSVNSYFKKITKWDKMPISKEAGFQIKLLPGVPGSTKPWKQKMPLKAFLENGGMFCAS